MKRLLTGSYLLILVLLFFGCGETEKSIQSLDDLKGVKIGAMTGSTGEHLAQTRFPEAETKSFDDIMDGVAALKSDQLEAVITGFPAALNVCKHNPDLMLIKEPVDYENTAMAVRKDSEALLNQVNEIIAELKTDGTLDDLKKRWFKSDLSPYEELNLKLPEKGEPLVIGTSATREPFCFVNAKQEVSGHDGELARILAIRLNRPAVFKDMKFAALIPALQSGKVDIIIAGMTATDERRKSVNFSESYFTNSQVIIVKKPKSEIAALQAPSKKLRTLDDIKDKKIALLMGSTHDTWAKENLPNAVIMQFKSPSEILLAVKSGKADAAIYTHETLLEIFRVEKEMAILGDTLFAVPIGMGFNKNNTALKDDFNRFLREIKNNGVFDDMVKRWISEGSNEMPVIENKGSKGTLIVGTVGDKGLPFTALKDNKLVGFDIELSDRFGAYLGKSVKYSDMDFGSLIAAAATNKIDMIASTLMITPEREKQIAFSNGYLKLGASVFALKSNIEEPAKKKLASIDDISDKRVAVYEGTVHDAFVAKKYPTAKILRYKSAADMIMALKSEKADAAFFDARPAELLIKSNPDVGILADNVLSLPLGVGFNKNNPELRKKFNKFLAEAKADGTFDEICKRWLEGDAEKAVMPKFNFDKGAPKLILAAAVADLPHSAIMNGEHVGLDIEMIKTFARKEGYNLEILTLEFASLVPALASGKADMIVDAIAITEERQKQVDFSDSYLHFNTTVLALKKNMGKAEEAAESELESTSGIVLFWNSIKDGFYSNIILEDRYLLLIDGLKTTVIISILATIFGTLLGALVCFMRMSGRKLVQNIAKVYISVLRGTPVLVVLMITFYVIFASVNIDPVIVAVIAFGMNFAAYVSEMFRTGIEGVDRGQTEAGIAMGFTKVKTFLFIVLPQAARSILPVYKGEFISLVKMTSIVGYIAVQDLTKASDIIRSRTFDAFFPLIMVAILYYLISWLLMLSLGYIEKRTDPKTRKRNG